MIKQSTFHISHFTLMCLVMLLMVACKPSLPDGVLDEDTMAEVLYDIHISHFIPDQPGEAPSGTASIQLTRQMQILKEHGISQHEWDTSQEYYARHADLLMKVYNQIYENMSGKAMAMGVTVGGVAQIGEDDETDSTDIWSSADHFMLISQPPYATTTWQITPKDSVLKTGERLTFRFFARYMNPQAMQKCTALIAIRLDNDSTIQSTTMIGSFGANSMTVVCPDNHKIKDIRGMFSMGRPTVTQFMGQEVGSQQSKMPQALLIAHPHLLHSTPIIQVKDTLDKSPSNVYIKNSHDSVLTRDAKKDARKKRPGKPLSHGHPLIGYPKP